MNTKTIKNKTLGIFLSLALILSLAAVVLPATPVHAATTWYVSQSSGVDIPANGTGAHPWLTIGYAIVQPKVLAGDTISVQSGTYNESLTINKSVTIQGAGSGVTTIDGAHTVTANNVSLSGFTFEIAASTVGFTINSSLTTISGFNVTNCIFNMTTSPVIGITIGAVPGSMKVSSVTINYNTFNGPGDKNANPWRIGGWFGTPIGCEVEGLTFRYNTVDSCSTPINLQNFNITNILIDNNTYVDTDGAVYVWAQSASAPSGKLKQFVFTNNTLTATNTYGVAFIDESAATSPFTSANFDNGNKVNNNNFSGVTGGYGLGSVSLMGTVTPYRLDATLNTWGGNGCPAGEGGGGSGAPVSLNVNFSPSSVAVTNPTSALRLYSSPGSTATVAFNVNTCVAQNGDISVNILQAGTSTSVASAAVNNVPLAYGSNSSTADVTLSGVVAGTYDVKVSARQPTSTGTWVDSPTQSGALVVDSTLPSVTLMTPNGGNYIKADADYIVRWNATDAVPAGSFDEVKGLWNTDGSTTYPPGNVAFTRSNVPKGEQTATWLAADIPDTNNATCKLQLTVKDAAGNSKSVASATNFTILYDSPAVTSITAPSASTSWNGGSNQTISFTASSALNLNVDYKIEFYNGSSWSNISAGDGWVLNKAVTSAINHSWTVNNAYRGSSAKIRITVRDKAGHLSPTVESSEFTINDVTKPTVTINAPTAGAKLYSGIALSPGITWTATDNVPGKDLTYTWWFSYNGGTSWTQLGTSSSPEAQGTINKDWKPSVVASSTNCKIKVTATDQATVPNTSLDAVSGVFSVLLPGTGPTVTVTDPTATGISMQVGNTYTIKWSAGDAANTAAKLDYKIELLKSDVSIATIATLTNQPQGARTFSWSVTDPGSDYSALYKIKVTATNPGTTQSGNDASDNNFTITAAEFAVDTASIPLVYNGTYPTGNGWNMISLPLIPTNTAIENILGPIIDNVEVVWYYSGGASGTWSSYKPGVSGTTPAFLTKMEDGKAYLIKVKDDCTLTFQGRKGPALTARPPVYSYLVGWNLVGFKSTGDVGTLTVDEYLASTTFNDPVTSFDNTAKAWTSVAGGSNMTTNNGYWVYFTAATIVTPPLDQ